MSRIFKEALNMGKIDNPILLMGKRRNGVFILTKISISKLVSAHENLTDPFLVVVVVVIRETLIENHYGMFLCTH